MDTKGKNTDKSQTSKSSEAEAPKAETTKTETSKSSEAEDEAPEQETPAKPKKRKKAKATEEAPTRFISEEERKSIQRSKMKDFKRRQSAGKLKTMKGNIDPDYEFITEEEGLIHARMTKSHYQQSVNKMIDDTKVVKMPVNVFKQQEDFYKKLYDSIELLHDPRESE